MEKGAAVEYINIAKLNIKGCLGCNECKKDQTKFCSILNDDMTGLYAKLNEADVILHRVHAQVGADVVIYLSARHRGEGLAHCRGHG